MLLRRAYVLSLLLASTGIALGTPDPQEKKALPSGAPAVGHDDLCDAIPTMRHMLQDVSLSFIRIERFGRFLDGEAPEESLAQLRDYQFSGDGYRMTSRSLDPLVTPTRQREGADFWLGQNSLVLYDGRIEMSREDVPESEEDLVMVSTEPTHMDEMDPRLFGLASILFPRIETIEPSGDQYRLKRGDGLEARVDLDLSTMTCRSIEIYRCGETPVGEYRFSGFRKIDLGEGRPTLWYPTRSELRKFDSTDHRYLVHHVTYVLRDVDWTPGLDVERTLQDQRITAQTLVMDDRFVPTAHYRAGVRGGPPVTFASMGASLLDRLQHDGEAHDCADHADGATAATARAAATSDDGWPGSIAAAALLIAAVGLMRLSRGVKRPLRRAHRQTSSAASAALAAAMLGSFTSAASAQHRASDSVTAAPTSLRWDDVAVHELRSHDVTIHNRGPTTLSLRVEPTEAYVVAWPRAMSLEPEETVVLSITAALPAGTASVRSEVLVQSLDATLLAIPIDLHAVAPSIEDWSAAPPDSTAPLLAARPRLEADRFTHDFGDLIDSEQVTVEIPFRNAGDAPLEIRQVEKECGCTQATVSVERLEPGESGVLTTKLAPENREGEIDRGVLLVTNDPVEPISRFSLRAHVIPEITIEPARVDLGVVGAEEEAEALLTVRFAGAPRALTGIESRDLTLVDHAWVLTEDGAELAAILRATGPDGPVAGALTLHFEGRRLPHRVEVHGEIRAALYAEPNSIGFAFIDGDDPSPNGLEFAVITRAGDRIERADYDAGLVHLKSLAPREGELARYRVSPMPGLATGFFSTAVQLYGSSGAPLSVPVRGFVGAGHDAGSTGSR